ncbi:MAG TPA: hypothetical protein VMM79_14390 [Longimicrobiales bacterium]|nr:hypothetical protein [Longimicrobiales bacterium]
MGAFDPRGFGERLRRALDDGRALGHNLSDVKALQAAVHQRTDARGTSYGSIWSYVNGQAPLEPRREVVEALAVVLGVRVEWLLQDDGAMTEIEQHARETVSAAAPRGEDSARKITEAFASIIPNFDRLNLGTDALYWAWLNLLNRSSITRVQSEHNGTRMVTMKGPGSEEAQQLAREIAEAVIEPARRFGVDVLTEDYVVDMCRALVALHRRLVEPTETGHIVPTQITLSQPTEA